MRSERVGSALTTPAGPVAPAGSVGSAPARHVGAVALGTLVAVRRARDLIDRSYAEPLDLDELAAVAGYSRSYFVRAFRAAYGETPRRYLTRRRVERAQELLRSVDLNVTEVCHLVGFSSLGSFSALFTDLVGTSPSAFQRKALAAAPRPIPGCYVLMWSAPLGKRAITEKQPRANSE